MIEFPADHFERWEFSCKCGCGYCTVDAELLFVIDATRKAKGILVIGSGCRCASHNKKVGGAENSQHLVAKAADLHPRRVTPQELYDYLDRKYPNQYGIGLYETFVHFDVRAGKARW